MRKNQDQIAIYSRKSRFTGKGESIGNQTELCRQYVCNMFGAEYGGRCVVFEDEGFSGGNLRRPDFQRMLEQVRRRQFRAIVVYRLDRISRNISDFTTLIDELTRLDVAFISIREQFDTSTPMGRAMMFIISVFSQLERETIAERIRDNMHELAKTGRWLGGNTPTGYESESVSHVTLEGKIKKTCRLKPVDQEGKLIKTIFDLYTQTDSLTATEAELLRRGLKSKNGKDFTRFTIKGILQNPVYMSADEAAYRYFMNLEADICQPAEAFDGTWGIMAYNRTDQEKGRTAVLLPESQWIIAVGKHPALISSRQWIEVQKSLERNKSKAYRKPRSNQALLTGVLFCACGERMYPRMSGRQADSFTYVCRMKERSKGTRCKSPNLNGNGLDMEIVEYIMDLPEDTEIFAKNLQKNRNFLMGSGTGSENQLENLRETYRGNERVMEGLLDSLGMAGDSDARHRIIRRIEELTEKNKEIETRIREVNEMMEIHMVGAEMLTGKSCILASFRHSAGMISMEGLRRLVRSLVRKILWDGSEAHVFLHGVDE